MRIVEKFAMESRMGGAATAFRTGTGWFLPRIERRLRIDDKVVRHEAGS
jgi:hypothetical protein